MEANLYILKCLTNMHVGNGEANFNIIDNEVERDPLTGLPVINSSGVKGAFRMYVKQLNNNDDKADQVEELFGSSIEIVGAKNKKDADDNNEEQKSSTPGNLKFLSAGLLGLPLRASVGSKAWYMATTKEALLRYCHLLNALGINDQLLTDKLADICKLDDKINYKTCSETIGVEGINEFNDVDASLAEVLKKLFGCETVLLNNVTMRRISLPVMARNQLDNGESKNLWYEEVVPHESLFYTLVLSEKYNKVLLDKFNDYVADKVVQFGGNATIGYGLCQVSLLAQAGK